MLNKLRGLGAEAPVTRCVLSLPYKNLFNSSQFILTTSLLCRMFDVCWVPFTRLMLGSYIVSHCAKIILTKHPVVNSGKERAWISKQHKVMRNFKGDGTITANKILEANEYVCLCLWQWLRGVNRGISSRLQSLNTSHSHNWIKSVRLLLNCTCNEEHEMNLAPKCRNFSFSLT